jgi:plasmid stabilization system protein ParE
MRLRWTENALKALIGIESYIAQENPAAAKKVFNLLYQSAE